MKKRNVLIVDDDPVIRKNLAKEIERNFFNALIARDGKSAIESVMNNDIDIVLLDVKLPDASGLDILSRITEIQPNCEVIVITGYGTQEIAIRSLRRGAIDYVEKPIDKKQMLAALGRAQEKLIQKEELSFQNTLLVIDDDAPILKVLKRTLEKEGYLVFTSDTGNKGLKIIRDNKIDVIITDIKMKDINGIEVLKRAKKIYQDIEGIMVTGYRDNNLAIKALRAGAIDYINKPIVLDELLFSINKAIERINLNRNRLYRNRELKITTEIISKLNEELERRIEERSKELSQTQAQLFQTSKLATLGEMSAGLAHEMNQPLGGISLTSANIRKLHERNKLSAKELLGGLNDIDLSVKRMTKVIQHIRTFARQDTLKFIEVNIKETIESALSLLSEQLRLHQIKVSTKYAGEEFKVMGEPYQMEQVWINLISNARDAMDDKANKKNDDETMNYKKHLKISVNLKSAENKVEIIFKDNGVGIDTQNIEKVFEPFFTTKEVGKATGLGLSISYGIIESHHGKIQLKSINGRSTSVHVVLPILGEDIAKN